ncbi:MAG: hypothetical protein GYA30_13615, partial [Chloroflexi bacterium]|nr:hypothetical protein [Chloroflexota bacterium]
LAEWPRWLPQAYQTGKPLVAFGGHIFVSRPEWQLRVPGHYLGDSLDAGLETFERLMQELPGR